MEIFSHYQVQVKGGGGVSATNGYFHLPFSQSMQSEVLSYVELNPKFLTKSIKSRIFDRALEFAEHPIRTRK